VLLKLLLVLIDQSSLFLALLGDSVGLGTSLGGFLFGSIDVTTVGVEFFSVLIAFNLKQIVGLDQAFAFP